jgi:heat shock protein HslJ
MNRRAAVRSFAGALALAALGACATPVTMPWDPRRPVLTGTVWRWTETLAGDDARVRPVAPERYTLEFLPDGAVRARADCNTASGRYEAGPDRRLALGRMSVTQAACLPGSLGDAYLKGLADVTGYMFDGDQLVLMLRHDTGTMRFVALKR